MLYTLPIMFSFFVYTYPLVYVACIKVGRTISFWFCASSPYISNIYLKLAMAELGAIYTLPSMMAKLNLACIGCTLCYCCVWVDPFEVFCDSHAYDKYDENTSADAEVVKILTENFTYINNKLCQPFKYGGETYYLIEVDNIPLVYNPTSSSFPFYVWQNGVLVPHIYYANCYLSENGTIAQHSSSSGI